MPVIATLVLCYGTPAPPDAASLLKSYFKQNLGVSDAEISSIRNGQPFARVLAPRTPAEIIVFGAVYINADPENYVRYAYDFNRLRKIPGYLAINQFSTPPQLSDLRGFGFDSEDVQSLKDCKPGNCAIQLPGNTMEDLRHSVDWSAPNVDDQVNQHLQKLTLARLQLYQKEGNHILGAVYNDKKEQVTVADQFAYILSYAKALQHNVPELYDYLVNYPHSNATNATSTFYWDKVKFGLKPTLRIVQVITIRGNSPEQPAYTIAEKQLYSSHYFETALDLTYCIRDSGVSNGAGFYLVHAMGSEQAGLTGFKGSIVRRVAVSHSVSDMATSLREAKTALEHGT